MSTRILLFTGKGGVGKTTCAAATALHAAESGAKTLVLSSDPAHSLADALGCQLGPEPAEIAPNLDAMEVDLYYSMRKHWGHMRDLLLTVFKWQGVDDVAAQEMAGLPGMSEGTVLLWLEQFYSEGNYDLIVVDSAPTGETLTLLTLPQVTQWWIKKAFPFQKFAFQTIGAAIRTVTGIPVDKGYNELEQLLDRLKDIQEVLSNPEICSMRIVSNPERMVIQESRRAWTYLQLYGYGVDAILVNRIMPAGGSENDKSDPWFGYRQTQSKYLKEIETTFSPLPILKIHHQRREVFGLDLLREIGNELYENHDPMDILYAGATYKLDRVKVPGAEDGYLLSLRIPELDDIEPDVQQQGDALIIQLNNQRRNMTLPQFLAFFIVATVKYEDGWLKIWFRPADDA